MMARPGERPFKCTDPGCEMAFKSADHLKNHIKSKHGNERPFKCKFPGCVYSTKIILCLASHIIVHSDDRPFACSNSGCNFRDKRRSNIHRHEKCVHGAAKTFGCSKCDYKAARVDTLKDHMRRHTMSKDFKCSYQQCAKCFKTLSELKRHLSHRQEERIIQCDHPGCGRKFANAKVLNAHKRCVHSNINFACSNPDCSYRTNIKANFTSHMIVHDKESEKISCGIKGCEFKGKNRRSFKFHMRRHETMIKCPIVGCGRYTVTNMALKNLMKLHDKLDRPHACPLCFKRFFRRFQLCNHIAAHTKEKPLRCGHCEFGTSYCERVRTHISSVHASINFPYIMIHPLNDRECIRCKVTLSLRDFSVHSMSHKGPIVMIERLEIKCP